MPRPLRPHGVAQLEELFANSKSDARVLKQLEHELRYRQVPRAVALLAMVQAAMHKAGAATAVSAATNARSEHAGAARRPLGGATCVASGPTACPDATPGQGQHVGSATSRAVEHGTSHVT